MSVNSLDCNTGSHNSNTYIGPDFIGQKILARRTTRISFRVVKSHGIKGKSVLTLILTNGVTSWETPEWSTVDIYKTPTFTNTFSLHVDRCTRTAYMTLVFPRRCLVPHPHFPWIMFSRNHQGTCRTLQERPWVGRFPYWPLSLRHPLCNCKSLSATYTPSSGFNVPVFWTYA